jgi:indolepyruvate ferredoxin oxidoreductase beta subunit
LRFHEENARIEEWLSRVEAVATENYLVAVELARAQRLVKGYGETHERGWRNFSTLLEQVDLLASRSDGGTVLARLIEAALADEEGAGLRREISALRAS